MIIGYISLLCLFLLVSKFIARKVKAKRIDLFLGKIHKPVSCIFLLSFFAHILSVIPVLKSRGLLVAVTGIIAVLTAMLLILLCHTIKSKSKKMLLHRIFSVLLLLAVFFHITAYYADFIAYQDKIKQTEISEVDISNISDGVYIGEYDAGYIYAKVQVSVYSGEIRAIDIIEHRNERGQKAEEIIYGIVEQQRIDVDAITSATNSSIVIKKAVENALQYCDIK